MTTYIDKHRNHLNIFMHQHNLNANNWAKMANISEGTLRAYLTKRSNNISLDTLNKLATAINVKVSDLIDDQKINYNLDENKFLDCIQKVDGLIEKKRLSFSSEKKAQLYLAWYKLSLIVNDKSADIDNTFDLIL
jgi:transcriptional regulator with XRE-family HTH domain